ncbi:MAG: CinA family protein [Promethearchaeota archaeon]
MNTLKKLKEILHAFTLRGYTIAVAESCTGGYVCHMITNISGASKVFDRGVICYSNEAKIEILSVNPQYIQEHGAVSEPIAFELARNIRELSNVDLGIGITGIAGPTGGTPEKPVGLVFIGFSAKEMTIVEKHYFKANRIEFKEKVLGEIVNKLDFFIKNDFRL